MPRSADESAPVRLAIVGGRPFSRPLTKTLASLPGIVVEQVAATGEDASAISDDPDIDVLLVEASIAGAVDSSMPQGRVVLAPWVVKWREADETAAVSRSDVVAAAILIASAGRSE